MSRSFRLASLALAATLAVAAACRDVSAPNEDPATTTFAPSLNVNLAAMKRTASGVYYQDLIVGAGKVAAKDSSLRVYYTGSLTSGQRFDSTTTGAGLTFLLGAGQVIKGWDEGIPADPPMRVGGTRRLVIPPALGYGSRTNGRIPAGSVLVFDVRLIAVGS